MTVTYGQPVHIHRGRKVHYALDFSRTLCKKPHLGEPAPVPLDRFTVCEKCWHAMGCSPLRPTPTFGRREDDRG